MRPRELVERWVDAFNRADADALAAFYAEDAVNHQVAEHPVHGRAAIREMFLSEFLLTKMSCIPEHIFEDGEWAILEWRDRSGLRGCGFFQVSGDKIVFNADIGTSCRSSDCTICRPRPVECRSLCRLIAGPVGKLCS